MPYGIIPGMHVTMADYILELVHNAVESGAETVTLQIIEAADVLTCRVSDNGCGMNPAQQAACRNPYATDGKKHPGRRMGLGLSLLAQLLDATDGDMTIVSTSGEGTRVTVRFNRRHIDTPPMGDLVELFLCALIFKGDHEMRIERRRMTAPDGRIKQYGLSRREVRDILGGLEDVSALSALRRFLREREDAFGPAAAAYTQGSTCANADSMLKP